MAKDGAARVVTGKATCDCPVPRPEKAATKSTTTTHADNIARIFQREDLTLERSISKAPYIVLRATPRQAAGLFLFLGFGAALAGLSMGDFPGFRNKLPFLGTERGSGTYLYVDITNFRKIAPTRPKNTDVFADADLIFSLPMYSLLSFLAIQGTRDHWDKGYEAHWYANEGSARHFVMLYAAMNLVHIPITILKVEHIIQGFPSSIIHVRSRAGIACCIWSQWHPKEADFMHNTATEQELQDLHDVSSPGLLNDRLYFFAAFDGVCEVSTLALTTLFILKDGLVGKGSVVNTLITINGVVLWLTYFVRTFTTCLRCRNSHKSFVGVPYLSLPNLAILLLN
eukprot:1394653-Amorphochlora_amoeboformis.AAC.2